MVMVVGYLKNGCPDIILYRIGLYYHWLYPVSFRINVLLLSLNTILKNINTTTAKLHNNCAHYGRTIITLNHPCHLIGILVGVLMQSMGGRQGNHHS